MKIMLLFIISTICFITPTFAKDRDAVYGIWESRGSAWNHTLKYPDFDLRFIEKKDGPFYPNSTSRRMSPIYVFNIMKEAETQELKWSAGTGDIGPVVFSVQGKKYVFEMLRSVLVDENVPEHKVIIWQEDEFQRRSALNH